MPGDGVLDAARLEEERPRPRAVIPGGVSAQPPSALQLEMRAYIEEAREEGSVSDVRHVLERLVETPTPSRLRSDAALELAAAMELTGERDAALALLEYHRLHGPPHASLEESLARQAEASGELERALKHWTAATRADAQHLRSWLGSVRVLEALGRTHEAADAMLRYQREVMSLRVQIEELRDLETRLDLLDRLDSGVREAEASRALTRIARSPDHALRQRALHMLARNGHPASLPVLESMREGARAAGDAELLEQAIAAIQASGARR